jgi:hypothetical protein
MVNLTENRAVQTGGRRGLFLTEEAKYQPSSAGPSHLLILIGVGFYFFLPQTMR